MIDIEYWGNHKYDINSKTLYFNRNSGLCSCISVLTHLLAYLKWGKNFVPEKIITNCTLYKDLNLYDYIFSIKDLPTFNNFDNEKLKLFTSKAQPSWWGIGTTRYDIVQESLNILTETFFNFQDSVVAESNKIKAQCGLNGDYNFILWRETDKVQDIPGSKYPSVEEALSFVKNNLITVCHTDDQKVADKMKLLNVSVLEVLPRTPTHTNSLGGHHYLNTLTKEQYLNLYGHTFEEHIIKLFAILHIASTSKTFVGYPGNMSFFVSMLRKGFENSFIFNERNKLY